MRFSLGLFLFIPSFAADYLPIPASRQSVADAATGFTVTVEIGAFQIGRTEVTQAEYLRLMGANPSVHQGANRPVENVTWHEAIQFANRLSNSEKRTPCYNLISNQRVPICDGYRLPTSLEWAAAFDKPDPAAFRNTGYLDPAALLSARQAGTRDVAQSKPNRYGVYDMSGNVWEWCEDWFSPEASLDRVRDPQGPPRGQAKVIRGGSYMTGSTQWNKELRNSMPLGNNSPFTGFRLILPGTPAAPPSAPSAEWLSQFQHRSALPIPPLARTPEQINSLWKQVLGVPSLPANVPTPKPVQRFTDATWNASLLDLPIEPSFPTRILVVEPLRKPAGRLPVVIVPYYDVDTPAGVNLGGRRFTAGGARAYARLAAQRGMLAVAVKWYGEADAEGYDEAVFQLAQRHPGVTPMGKWVFDVQRVVDYLATRPDVDPARIGIFGHSLGGKLALYAAAFDPRIRATVSSEPGISLTFSNYADFWYFGPALKKLPAGADQHELLRLIAPRPFLLIGGESSDGAKSWPFLAAVQSAYPVKEHIGMINHASGHSPTEKSVQSAMEWLERFLRQ
ncbi:MAG TPA: SUMF1/EgtB/PvdO family nonheme iron enzyme [Bryobacteraceae bacterium]|nr:SUMF1/EgtB/PvdO family nonheme iron enzyme [Bryobacteraceae bacterium]